MPRMWSALFILQRRLPPYVLTPEHYKRTHVQFIPWSRGQNRRKAGPQGTETFRSAVLLGMDSAIVGQTGA